MKFTPKNNKTLEPITSLQNPSVLQVASLHDFKGRGAHRQFIVEGVRALEAFLDAGWNPECVYLSEIEQENLSLNFSQDIPVRLVTQQVMKKMSTAVTPSGVLAVFPFAQHKKPVLDKNTRAVVLAQISDPGNMGTLIRTVASMGITHIFSVEGCDPYSPKVVQASAGALAIVQIHKIKWPELIKIKQDKKLCALVVAGGQAPQSLDMCDSLLVIGNEAHGLPLDWIEDCEQKLTLSMPGATESLNAAVAGSIALYLQYQACTG